MKTSILCMATLLLLSSCNKLAESIIDKGMSGSSVSATEFTQFFIPQGKHSCTESALQSVNLNELKIVVHFDSSAIYRTSLPENQYDIHKLFGFSDNNAGHHQYSARIGWRWSDNALRLFAYVYNAGERQSAEIASVPIGTDVQCSIGVTEGSYLFTVNGKSVQLPRLSTTPAAKGYQLYPYFGGDEPAPHDVKIWIKKGA